MDIVHTNKNPKQINEVIQQPVKNPIDEIFVYDLSFFFE